ncbi:hypothetical protein LINGRAHAP2_LOCUS3253 [Linum grandiflorum]
MWPHIAMMLITLTTSSFFLPAISVSPAASPEASAAGSPSGSPAGAPFGSHKQFIYPQFKELMCSNYDPQMVAEAIKPDSPLMTLCDSKLNTAKCLDFLGNKPNADPAYAIKTDAKTIQEMLKIQAVLAKRNKNPELKVPFEACHVEFNKAANTLDDVVAACDQKITKQATALLGNVAANLRTCDKAFEGMPDIKQMYTVKDTNDEALAAITKILSVSKKFNE